ncbi:zinc finger matrin-type protein 4 isoform X1 [Oncorhynchus keta]|uniref:zinc finger matrin-type protein 4 isoform X1 n=1 Tax=Oncorhynchus keta TaxID=8018 RepID=UPI00227AA30D|nr:zinc finger matrin-type protein 4 isoform X1 [Oncorhynchus keta]
MAQTLRRMWQGLQTITDYKGKTSNVADTDVLLPDKLNTIFIRFQDNTVPPTRLATKDCGLSFSFNSRKHANKVRLYYMLHPVDGGCPAKKLRTDNGSEEGDVDKNKCCTLCNMSFTSAVVAQSHYQGKIHAKRLKLLLGEQPAITAKEAPPSPVKSSPETTPLTSPRQRRDSDRYCQLCNAWFNNPGMAQQHYDGKKHKKNAARADLLEQLGKTLDMGEMKGLKRSYTCEVCSVTLNSVAQYHAHLQGSKHQNNLKNQICVQ